MIHSVRIDGPDGTSVATRGVRAPAREDAAEEVNSGHLRAFIERIERLHEERKALADDVSEVYAEAKANGFDVKIIRQVIAIRSKDPEKRAEEETLLDLYLAALGQG